jgi:hypothetical protein
MEKKKEEERKVWQFFSIWKASVLNTLNFENTIRMLHNKYFERSVRLLKNELVGNKKNNFSGSQE